MAIATVLLPSINDIVPQPPGDGRSRCVTDVGRAGPCSDGSVRLAARPAGTITAVRVPVGRGVVGIPGHDRYARQLTGRLHRAVGACGHREVLSSGSIYLEGALGVPEALLRCDELALVAAVLAADPAAPTEPRSLGQVLLSGRLRGSGAVVAGRLSRPSCLAVRVTTLTELITLLDLEAHVRQGERRHLGAGALAG